MTMPLTFKSRTKDFAKTPDLAGSLFITAQLDFSENTSHHVPGILSLRGHETTDLARANSALGGKDGGGSREKEGDIPRAGGGMLEKKVEDQVYASGSGLSGICQPLSKQGLRHTGLKRGEQWRQ